MNSYVQDYEEYRGDFAFRTTGSLVADRAAMPLPMQSIILNRGDTFCISERTGI